MRCLYVDLDGTLLGPGGVLVRDADGDFTLLGVRAIEACTRAGAEVVLMSGRRQAQVAEDARLLGQTSYIFEAGSALVLDGEEHWLTGDLRPGTRTIHDQIDDSGAPGLLLERYAGRLEYHDPWHRNREVSHLFRGLVDAFEANALLAEHGHGDLRLVDNGAVHRRSPALTDLPQVRAYHLVPASASRIVGSLVTALATSQNAPTCAAVPRSSRESPTATQSSARRPRARRCAATAPAFDAPAGTRW